MQHESHDSTDCFLPQREPDSNEGGNEMLLSRPPLIQHAIMPDIKGNRKAIHMQIAISLCAKHRLEKTATLHHRPETMSGKTRQISQTWRVENIRDGSCTTEEAVDQGA